LKIVVNAIPLLSAKTGIGYYTYRLFKTLLQVDTANEYIFFYGKSFRKDLLGQAPSSSLMIKKQIKNIFKRPYYLPQLIFNSYFLYKGLIRHFDIYHETNYIPFRFKGKIITTVCDLSILLFPETHPKERLDHFGRYFHERVHWSERIITLSDYIKNEVVQHLGISPSRITSIPLAADEKFGVLEKNEVNNWLQNKGYPTDYILYIGAIEPRKNLKLLIKAFNNIRNEFKARYFLILAGPKSWLHEEDFRLIENLGIKNRIIMPGYIPDGDLGYLYNGSKLFVFPSLYEGFGLPPLEAMACGVPVITSNASSLPEVVGDAGILVDPHRVNELTEAMHLVLSNENLREEMREKGLNRAKMFSWKKCARATRKVYEEVYNQRI